MYVCTPSRKLSDVQRGALAIKHACVHVCTCIRRKTHEGRTQEPLKTSKASAFFLLSLVFAANKSHLPWTCRETQTNTRQEVPLGLDMLRDTHTHTHTNTHTHTHCKQTRTNHACGSAVCGGFKWHGFASASSWKSDMRWTTLTLVCICLRHTCAQLVARAETYFCNSRNTAVVR